MILFLVECLLFPLTLAVDCDMEIRIFVRTFVENFETVLPLRSDVAVERRLTK